MHLSENDSNVHIVQCLENKMVFLLCTWSSTILHLWHLITWKVSLKMIMNHSSKTIVARNPVTIDSRAQKSDER